MPARISLLLPTRGRPRLARRFFDSLVSQTTDLDAVEVILYVNEDDADSRDLDDARLQMTMIVGPEATMGDYNMACLERACGQAIMLINDDLVIRTPGWDRAVLELHARFPDGVYLGYVNDQFKRHRVSTFPILSRATCDLLVSPYPRQYRGALIDYHLFDIFKRLEKLGHKRICYLADVVFDHLHYRTGEVPFDQTYGRRGRFDDDCIFVALRNFRQAGARRLADSIEGIPLAVLPCTVEMTLPPQGMTQAFAFYVQTFLRDEALPAFWRTFLFVWFCGRCLANHGYLGWIRH